MPSLNPQINDALARANYIRLARADIKRDIRMGTATVVDVLETMPEPMWSMTLAELLRCQMRWGIRRARKFCQTVNVSENRKLQALTQREVTVIKFQLKS